MSKKCRLCGVDLSDDNPKSKTICPDCIRMRFFKSWFQIISVALMFGFIIIIGLLAYLINVTSGNIV